jgi:hypothetical protein
MAKDDDLELDQLLAGGRLSGGQYDEISRRVLARVAPARARRWWPLWGGIAVSASALGAWLLLSRGSLPLAPGELERVREGAGFVAKGAAESNPIGFDLGCDNAARTCRVGDTLLLSLASAASAGYVGAYAERSDAPPGERIWYFPDAAGAAPRVEAASGRVVLSRGVRLGPPHAPGRYRVTLWLSAAPPQRGAPAPAPGTSAAVLALDIVE